MTQGVVSFDYSAWVLTFPEFAGVSEPRATMFFAEATLYLNNTAGSRVTDLGQRALLLNLITAHLAWLNRLGPDGQPLNPLVGRISDATEGSVSVRAELAELGQSAAFWSQSQYGLRFWQATARFRTAIYRPVAPYCFPPDRLGIR